MRRKRELIPRARHPWAWLGGLFTFGILIAGIVAAALMLWESVDIQRLTRMPGTVRVYPLPDPSMPAPPAFSTDGFPAVIYASTATAAYFPEEAFYPDILDRWAAIVSESGGVVRRVSSAADVAELEGRGIVVAPSAVCLDSGEVGALRRHAEAGGGLVLTWATGARDGQCEWRGWDVVQELTGALDVREIERREGLFLTVPAETSLSGGIDPASRIELRWDSQLAIETTGGRPYWSDWALNPRAADGTRTVDTAAALRSLDRGGRIVWFGFEEHQGVTELDEARIRRLLRSGVHWAAGVPTVEVLPWPGGSRAGLVVAQAVSGEFANARHLAEMARSRGIPTTSFVVSQLARAHPELAHTLQKAGEVGSQTSDNTKLSGVPVAEQQTRLRRSVTEVVDWTGARPVGLRPPEEGADVGTLKAWHDLGGTYLVGLNDGRTGSPEVISVEGGRIVLLPRMMKDDYNLLIQERTLRPEDFARELEAGLRKLRSLGGLAVLMVHTELAGSPRYLGPLGTMLDNVISDGGWWLATGSEVAEWSLARSETSVDLVRIDEDRFEIEVRAPSRRAFSGGWLTLDLPEGSAGWAPEGDGGPLAYGESGRGLEIPIGDLSAGESRTIAVTRVVDREPTLAP